MKQAGLVLAALLALSGAGMAQDVDRPGHREWRWDGGDTLHVSGAMAVRVRKDGPPRVVMTGPEALVRRAFLRSGHLGTESNFNWWGGGNSGRLEVTISGAAPAHVTVSGSSQVTLATLRQPELAVRISGSGGVRANGQVENLQARVSGSGDARLEGLTSRRGEFTVSGSGTVAVDAADEAEAHVSGSGQVRIKDAPRQLAQSVSGSGRIAAGNSTYRRR